MSEELPDKNCPVVVYSRGERVVVGEATFTKEDGENIASIKLTEFMPNFLEAYREGILTGLTITPERTSVQELYANAVEAQRKIQSEDRVIEGETIQYKKMSPIEDKPGDFANIKEKN